MARSRIVIVEGKTYLVPRKKYKVARKGFRSSEETWAHIMRNIEDFGMPLEEGRQEAAKDVRSEGQAREQSEAGEAKAGVKKPARKAKKPPKESGGRAEGRSAKKKEKE